MKLSSFLLAGIGLASWAEAAPTILSRETTPSLFARARDEAIYKFIRDWTGYSNVQADQKIVEAYDKAVKIEPENFAQKEQVMWPPLAVGGSFGLEVLSWLKRTGDRASVIEVGAFFAPDTRWLAYKGIDPKRLVATNLKDGVFDIAFNFWKDEKKLEKGNFHAPFDLTDGSNVKKLEESANTLLATNVLHLFNLDKQKEMASNMLRLMKRGGPARMYIQGMGLHDGRDVGSRYVHSDKTTDAMWNEILKSDHWNDKVKSSVVKTTFNNQPTPDRNIPGGMRPGYLTTRVFVDFK
ncbi:Uu.00g122080.m01.CDS01 [Anthostomella pinea]|uniref:Uu.00g122080.m01.CDS01 n=1 Tax=Anthostomella pinea TaxID=933095 RepID=A0AAI8YHD0_9PEZI|nr:Uu.00g122080.m01.CDS01 [Anthostomella pinea]